MRDASNWKKGIPKESYIESLGRHWLDVRDLWDGIDVDGVDIEDALCAMRFNVNGLLHEILKEKS